MKANKYLEEVWEWKEKSNKEFEGLTMKEITKKIKEDTSETIKKLGLHYFQFQEKIKV